MRYNSIEDIYNTIPDLDCQGKCQECCGIIPLYPVEVDRIRATKQNFPYASSDMTCTALKEGQCSVYANRPFICRIWGNTKKLSCPFGCKPKEYLSEQEVRRMQKAMQQFSKGKPAVVCPQPGSIVALEGNPIMLAGSSNLGKA